MKITILGSGGSAGVPMIGGADGHGDWGACDPAEPRNRRTRSSIVIEAAPQGQGARLLVDTSPDLRTQLLACGVPGVDAILFTHAHADHIAGLDDVRILNRILGGPMPAAATRHTLDELTRRFDYAFKPWTTAPRFFRPVFDMQVAEGGGQVELAGMRLDLFDQDHGYARSLGLRHGNFAYCTDVVAIDEATMGRLEGLDTWLVGCFQREPHWAHAHVAKVIEWVARLRPRRTVVTHMGNDLDWNWLVANLPAGIEAAFDGMVLEVPG